jgi:hypothetical protein
MPRPQALAGAAFSTLASPFKNILSGDGNRVLP